MPLMCIFGLLFDDIPSLILRFLHYGTSGTLINISSGRHITPFIKNLDLVESVKPVLWTSPQHFAIPVESFIVSLHRLLPELVNLLLQIRGPRSRKIFSQKFLGQL